MNSTYIQISFTDPFNILILITHRLFKSWQECPAHLLFLCILPAPSEADNLGMRRMLQLISAQYPTIAMMVEMTIQNPTTSLISDHPGKQSQAAMIQFLEVNMWKTSCRNLISCVIVATSTSWVSGGQNSLGEGGKPLASAAGIEEGIWLCVWMVRSSG